MVTTSYVTDGTLGVQPDVTFAGTTTDGENAPFSLGTTVRASDGKLLQMVQAAAAISTTTNEPFFLAIDENYQAAKITKALANVGHRVGIAPQVAIADNAFFWAILTGANVNCRVAASCAADVALWTTATAGILDDTSGGSHVRVMGVALVVAASASTSAGNTVREAIIAPGGMVIPGLIA